MDLLNRTMHEKRSSKLKFIQSGRSFFEEYNVLYKLKDEDLKSPLTDAHMFIKSIKGKVIGGTARCPLLIAFTTYEGRMVIHKRAIKKTPHSFILHEVFATSSNWCLFIHSFAQVNPIHKISLFHRKSMPSVLINLCRRLEVVVHLLFHR